MLRLIKIFIKNDIGDKFIIALIIFLTSILLTFNAIGIHDGKNNALEASMGNTNHKKVLVVKNKNEADFKYLLNLLNNIDDTQISVDGIQYIHKIDEKNNKVLTISFTNFKSLPEWMPKVIYGRNFIPKDFSKKSEKVAVIGEGVYRGEFTGVTDSYVFLDPTNEKYKILGVVGDYKTDAPYISTVFLPLSNATDKTVNISNAKITLFKNGSSPTKELESIQNNLSKNNIESYEDNTSVLLDEDYNSKYTLLIIASIIISSFNMFLFYNYIINKNKKKIVLNLVLGSNILVSSLISFLEYTLISLISALLGILTCFGVSFIFKDMIYDYLFISNISLSYYEIIIPLAGVIIINLLISIYQGYTISKMDLSEQLKMD
ncbi:ABC transporter permease [Clostridium sp. C8-1-8]|uniref:ABC transporter permease n=1 Tax=Clostridium sp. C8-1-8 TaxID=2698831 RepID=UPI00136B446E|nr:ABC transporter permease [Clostridium sp. C8-1-8]